MVIVLNYFFILIFISCFDSDCQYNLNGNSIISFLPLVLDLMGMFLMLTFKCDVCYRFMVTLNYQKKKKRLLRNSMELPVMLSGLLLTKKRTITLFYYILIPLTSPSYSILISYRTLFPKRIGIFIINACLDLIFLPVIFFGGMLILN